MRGVLTLRQGCLWADPATRIGPEEAADAERLAAWLTAAAAEVGRRAEGGETLAAAMLLAGGGGGEADAGSRFAGVAPDATLGSLYAMAGDCLAGGDSGGAARILFGLSTEAEARGDALVGLAAIAAAGGRFDAAVTVAQAALEIATGHPRAHCILGYAEFERGNAKPAQHHLATATRLARRRPEFRDDQRAAQQLLLLLHLS